MKKWIIGIDEVARGPIAGPVTVCAVAMRKDEYRRSRFVGLTDSKMMTKKAREKWHDRARELEERDNIRIGIASRSAKHIDTHGITICIQACIDEALDSLGLPPAQCTVRLDGSLKAPGIYKDQKTIIKGDQKEKIISLASVIAKVHRDMYMEKMHRKYPQYAWFSNKGYGTKAHYMAILKAGLALLHRKTFLTRILDTNS